MLCLMMWCGHFGTGTVTTANVNAPFMFSIYKMKSYSI